MTDPLSALTGAKVTDAAIEEGRSLLGKFLGPAFEEIGGTLGDSFRLYRLKRSIQLLKKAEKLLADDGVSPKVVNPKTLLPLLDAGTLEEDEGMSDKWASLLAAAADPNATSSLEPSFSEILRQLSPIQAKVLDVIYQQIKRQNMPAELWASKGVVSKYLRSLMGLSAEDFGLTIDNLLRLRLIAYPSASIEHPTSIEDMIQLGSGHILCATHLGNAFVKACSRVDLAAAKSESYGVPIDGVSAVKLRGDFSSH
jgi:hypothetical protein